MLWKCCTQYVSKFGKLSSGHKTEKGQFSFQSQRRAMPKNAQTTIELSSFHMLARLCSKSFKLGFSSTWTENFQRYKLDFEKAEGPEIKLPAFTGSWRKQRSSRKTSTSAHWICESLWLCGSQQAWKFLKRLDYQTISLVSWETYMRVKKQQLEPETEKLTGLKLEKGYNKALYCHPACLTYMQSTSCEMPGWWITS